jgi:hypothetical protein
MELHYNNPPKRQRAANHKAKSSFSIVEAENMPPTGNIISQPYSQLSQNLSCQDEHINQQQHHMENNRCSSATSFNAAKPSTRDVTMFEHSAVHKGPL